MCAVTELWIHKNSTEESLKAIVPEGYDMSSSPIKMEEEVEV